MSTTQLWLRPFLTKWVSGFEAAARSKGKNQSISHQVGADVAGTAVTTKLNDESTGGQDKPQSWCSMLSLSHRGPLDTHPSKSEAS